MMNVKRHIWRAAVTVLTVAVAAGCFKKVSTDTRLVIKPNLQTVSGGEMSVAQGVKGYAFYGRGEDWIIPEYEDAVALRLTDTAEMVVETVAFDAETEPYADGEAGVLEMKTKSSRLLLLLVWEQEEMYAYRHYEPAENMSPTFLTMQFRTWKNDGYVDSGWTVGMTPRKPAPAPDPDPDPDPDDGDDDDDEDDGGDDEDEDDGNGGGGDGDNSEIPEE